LWELGGATATMDALRILQEIAAVILDLNACRTNLQQRSVLLITRSTSASDFEILLKRVRKEGEEELDGRKEKKRGEST
jgi:hypothetical protein